MYYNQSFDEMPEDMLLHGKLINDGGHNLFQRDPPPSFRKKRRRKYVDKEVEVDDSVFENAKQAVAPKEVKKDEIEESEHPPSEENITENSPESVENQAVEEISVEPQESQDKPNKTHKMPLRKLFDELYDTWLSLKWKTRRNMLISALKPYFENDYKKTVAFVDSNLDRRRHNTGSRFRRARNKCNLNRFNYFVTFTYSDVKMDRETFKKKLRAYLKNKVNEDDLVLTVGAGDVVRVGDVDMVFLMLTDILEESSDFLCVGDRALHTAERAFGVKGEGSSVYLEGAVSRKKQIIPKIASLLK